jgi:hypothetical protein
MAAATARQAACPGLLACSLCVVLRGIEGVSVCLLWSVMGEKAKKLIAGSLMQNNVNRNRATHRQQPASYTPTHIHIHTYTGRHNYQCGPLLYHEQAEAPGLPVPPFLPRPPRHHGLLLSQPLRP